MQIRRIQIADFGKLHDMELDFSEGFQTITGGKWLGKIHHGGIYQSDAVWHGSNHQTFSSGK